MKRRHVNSTAVSSVGYDPTKRILEIEYTEGKVYCYSDVTPGEFVSLVTAESVGAFVNEVIKPRHPRYWEV